MWKLHIQREGIRNNPVDFRPINTYMMFNSHSEVKNTICVNQYVSSIQYTESKQWNKNLGYFILIHNVHTYLNIAIITLL